MDRRSSVIRSFTGLCKSAGHFEGATRLQRWVGLDSVASRHGVGPLTSQVYKIAQSA